MKRTFSSNWPAPGRPVKRTKSFRKAQSAPKTLATKVNKLLRGIEHKNLFVSLTDSNNLFLQAGVVSLFGSVQQGTDDFERIGKKIHVDKFTFKMHVAGYTSAAPAVPLNTIGAIRLLWVWDKAPNQALATYGDIMDTTTAVSIPNPDNRKRFQILYDEYRNLNGMAADTHNSQIFKATVKVDKDQRYDGLTNVIGDITEGALLCVTCYDVIGTLAGTPTINMHFAEYFTDD